ncbi:MAG: helix-turn-helix transcriptional regulator [Hyphomicrobiaceae bacterium]
MPDDPPRHLIIINAKLLRRMVPYTLTHIRRLELAGRFPKRVPLGANRVGWMLVEVEAWIEARKSARVETKPNSDQYDLGFDPV